MASIFNIPFGEICFDDVDRLVRDKVGESVVLDYKREYKKTDTARLISAMANTYGGYILYGVECDHDTNEPTGYAPLSDEKLDDTIDSVCYDNITPPVFCEKKYLKSVDGTDCILLVKVPESDMTPHAVENNTVVYVKVAGQKRRVPERATLERQEWLQSRREKHVALRSKLFDDLRAHQAMAGAEAKPVEFTVEAVICPKHPRNRLIQYHELREFIQKQFETMFEKHQLLVLLLETYHVDNGMCCYVDMRETSYKRDFRYFFEFNGYGLCCMKFFFERYGDPEPNRMFVRPDYAIDPLVFAVDLGMTILDDLDYRGSRTCTLRIGNLVGTRGLMRDSSYNTVSSELIQGNPFQDSIEDTFELVPNESHGALRERMADLMGRLIHLYIVGDKAYEYGRKIVDASWKKVGMPVN